MTESILYQSTIKKFFNNKGFLCYRVEHPQLPDIYITRGEVVFWVELKCINKYQKIIKPGWRPGQLSWIFEQKVSGTDNVVLCLYYINKVYFLNPKEQYSQEDLQWQKSIFLQKIMKV